MRRCAAVGIKEMWQPALQNIHRKGECMEGAISQTLLLANQQNRIDIFVTDLPRSLICRKIFGPEIYDKNVNNELFAVMIFKHLTFGL